MLQPVPLKNRFIDEGFAIRYGSVIKDKNGKFYMLYSHCPLADVAFLNDQGKPQFGFYGYDGTLGVYSQNEEQENVFLLILILMRIEK
jgi:hypothetical protein